MHNHTRLLFAVAVAAVTVSQTALPADKKYEVVSIKPGTQGSQKVCGPRYSPLQFTAINCFLPVMIQFAYGLAGYQLVNAPAWTSSAWYNLAAKSVGPANPLEQWRMMQPVLEDRFKLKWHHEMRQLPVYYLSAAKGGPKVPITRAGSCVPIDPDVGPSAPGQGNPVSCGTLMPKQTSGGLCLDATGYNMETLAHYLAHLLGRPGIDRTGFKDRFDLHLEFALDETIMNVGRASAPAEAGASELPSIFAALKKLGLTLESGQGPVEVFVIDNLQKPLEN